MGIERCGEIRNNFLVETEGVHIMKVVNIVTGSSKNFILHFSDIYLIFN